MKKESLIENLHGVSVSVLAFFVVAWATVSVAAPSIWTGGKDTTWYAESAQAFNLTTAEELAGLAYLVNNGTTFQGKTITLGADIFLNDTTGAGQGTWSTSGKRVWTPIGTQSNPFKGEFDGLAGKKNRKIYGLYINDTTKNYVGLFGYTHGVKISNLDLVVGKIAGGNTAGALAGSASNGSVENVHSELDVSGKNGVGGLIGWSTSSISDCFVNASVLGRDTVGGLVGYASAMVKKSNYMGGFVKGYNNVGGLVGLLTKSVADSYSETYVEGRGNNVGGLIGYSFTRESNVDVFLVSRTYFKGTVKGENFVGGLIGKDSTYDGMGSYKKYFMNSFAEGDVKGSSSVGGLFGSVASAYDKGMAIDSCYHKNGNVFATSNYVGGLIGRTFNRYLSLKDVSHSDGYVEGMRYVGGLIGYHYAYSSSVKNAIANAHVKGSDYTGGLIGYSAAEIDDSYHIGNVYGGNYVGGVAGLSIYTMNNSFNKGHITGSNIVGGLVGQASDVNNSFSEGSVHGKTSIGGLVGVSKGTLSESYSKGNIKGTEDYVGGLIGKILYSSGDGITRNTILKSYFVGEVVGKNYVGGLVGIDTTYVYSKNVTNIISKSFSAGPVTGKSFVGGLLGGNTYHSEKGGRVNSEIDSAYHYEGEVLGDGENIGGIAGYTFGKISNSYVVSSVKGMNNVGGIAGSVGADVSNSFFIGDSVIGIYQIGGLVGIANGKVDSSYSTANVKGDDNVGGLIGSSYGNISYSYATGNVIGDVDNSSAGNDNLGGLVGYAYKGSISKSLATGDVSGTTKLGGLVGRFDGTSISQSYAQGNVTGSYYGDPSDEVGNFYIGGLVGYGKGSISEIYVSGSVKGIEDGPVYTGCIVGYVNGSMEITDSYFDSEKCNLAFEGKTGIATISNSPAQTTDAMQSSSTYGNWDFIDTWRIIGESYPRLSWFAGSLAEVVVKTASLEGFVYDGNEKMPAVNSVTLYETALDEGTDYTISYQNNVNAGTAIISICGIGAYSGCKLVSFEISPVNVAASIAAIDNQVYSGDSIAPNISVLVADTVISPIDYRLIYTNNINAGKGSVQVVLTGNYSGSAKADFIIEKAPSTILELPTAKDVYFGQTLADAIIEGGDANVEGSFVWSESDVIPDVVNKGYEITFVPADAQNHLTATAIIPLTVQRNIIVFTYGKDTLQVDTLLYGDLPQFDGELPKKESAQYVYTFKGWSPDIVKVAGSASYKAVYDSTIRKYTISFYSEDSLLQSSEIEYGKTPVLKTTSNPKKAMSAGYTYSFSGWSPKIVPVTENAQYVAVFDSTIRSYTISFMNGETVLKTVSVKYGNVPEYTGTKPNKGNTQKYKYEFSGWSPEISTVEGNVQYQAVFDSIARYYVVLFVNGKDTLQRDSLMYGETPKYKGSEPTRKSSSNFSYKFKGWTPEVASVTGRTTYQAVFDSAVITGIADMRFTQGMSLIAVNRNILISAAPVGSAYAIFDMQGRVLKKGRVELGDFSVVAPGAGSYFVQIGKKLERINVK